MYSLFFLYLSEQIYKIMKIKLLLISFLLAANALGAAAQVSKTYYVSKPGTLISMMTEEEANSSHCVKTARCVIPIGYIVGRKIKRKLFCQFIIGFSFRPDTVCRVSFYRQRS